MMNQGLALAHLFGLFLIKAFFGADIDVQQNIPSELSPGQETIITVDITKGNIQGFAKLQLEIPSGMTVSVVNAEGASFTFADQKAKFIWMALPTSEVFSITYNLQVSETAIGAKDITGRFSYIEDNERKTHDLPSSTVHILDAGRTALEGAELSMADPEQPSLRDFSETDLSVRSYPFDLVEAVQGPGDVTAERTITKTGPNDFLVDVQLTKGGIRGFGKLQETIPAGFVAMEKKSNDAIFTTQGEIVKFVWLNLPPDDILSVSYKLRAVNATESAYKIDGEFGYLLNDETQKATLASTPFTMEQEVLAQETESTSGTGATEETGETETGSEPIHTEELVVAPVIAEPAEQEPMEATSEIVEEPIETAAVEEPKVEEPVVEQAEEPVTVQDPDPVSTVPSAEHGITYKVQITAAHKDVGREYFISRHKFYDDFGIERHQGWTKYLTGKYGEYEDARDRRNNLVNKGHRFPGPFVTAYNDGQRITVQEALMISNQKWVQ